MTGHILALCGGVGGAKLAFGLARLLPPDRLTIAVNTGDDFEHLGLHVSPDIDTVVYTLARLSDRVRGWGLAGETWAFMSALGRLGGETWFNLGDTDLAMHVLRTQRLRDGETLSRITATLGAALGLSHAIVPMSDQPVRTVMDTDVGRLPFQRYFVGEQCRPVVRAIHFEGAAQASPSDALAQALSRQDLAGVIICPSNPYLSVDPILAVPGVRSALERVAAPIVAVSPIIGGAALKGPAAKLMAELGVTPSATAVARHYQGLLSGLVIDTIDVGETAAIADLGIAVSATDAVMTDDGDRLRLAGETLDLVRALA
ncbi:MAG: 2-phospho-L-lactate transferase [Alphaproteobacteria bacterium]|nr:2-phospho-L-lactate transferase [Alphaproteobacteria bacterium]MBU1516377.1 2-phospho-L-lactate transferase [Alphaproteobacteria bacterium]MBU2093386.1 2-phospho-L-lactate transferase [Alphaproteobacteria bacterium]MBU2153873.1 2-phospho-L-lactate transferase [Alphaproteobacteria bacterium]MBU2307745.1 2-phospho-L-lactate transferase [Alphaproteobacteria bacterium]